MPVELVRSRYADFGPTLATEVLLEKDGVKVSRETLRKWMVGDGLWRLVAVAQATQELPSATLAA